MLRARRGDGLLTLLGRRRCGRRPGLGLLARRCGAGWRAPPDPVEARPLERGILVRHLAQGIVQAPVDAAAAVATGRAAHRPDLDVVGLRELLVQAMRVVTVACPDGVLVGAADDVA